MKAGIDTNIFIKLFDSAESLNYLKEKGDSLYTHPVCLWEMVKYIKTLELEDKNTEAIVANFMKRAGIIRTKEEVEKEEIKEFEEKCKKEGIDCHYPDSEIILSLKKEGVERIYSDDKNFGKAAWVLGMKFVRFSSLEEKKPNSNINPNYGLHWRASGE